MAFTPSIKEMDGAHSVAPGIRMECKILMNIVQGSTHKIQQCMVHCHQKKLILCLIAST